MANLFAKKSMDVLMAEANATGVGTLKRPLGPFQLPAARGHVGGAMAKSCSLKQRMGK